MKRILLISCVFFLTLSITGSAQILVGVKGGINFNSFRKSEDYKDHFDVIPGLNLGAVAKYPVLPFLNARVELLYMQQGANIYDYTILSDLSRRKAKIRFHNVAVPVIAELGLPSLREDILQPKLLLGAFYSYTIYARESFENVADLEGRPAVMFDGHTNVTSQFHRGQYGLLAGIAAEVKMFSKPVSIEFRYQYNVNRANKTGTQNDYNLLATTEVWGNELRLHTLSINVGVTMFNF